MIVTLKDARHWQVEWSGPFTTRTTKLDPWSSPMCEKLGHDMRVVCQAPQEGPITIRSCSRPGCRHTDDIRIQMLRASRPADQHKEPSP